MACQAEAERRASPAHAKPADRGSAAAPCQLGDAAALVESFGGYSEINLNVGCPSKKVSQGKMGACLMKEAELVRDCLSGMREETSMDVSLKCRIGVDEFDSYDFFRNFISTVLESDVKVIFIHARKAFLKGLDPKKNRTLLISTITWCCF